MGNCVIRAQMSCVCLRSVPPPKEVIGKPLLKYLSESPETFAKFISECGVLIMGKNSAFAESVFCT